VPAGPESRRLRPWETRPAGTIILSSLEALNMPDPVVTAPSGTAPPGGDSARGAGASALPDPVDIGPVEQDRLLALARVAVSVAAGALPAARLEAELEREPLPERRAAAFVTLEKRGELRGCMGLMDPETPAWESVVEASRWAALDDPRFPSLDSGELPLVEIEISILGPLVRLEDPLSFRQRLPFQLGLEPRRGKCPGRDRDRDPGQREQPVLFHGPKVHRVRERGGSGPPAALPSRRCGS
jgi:hypothetical protein